MLILIWGDWKDPLCMRQVCIGQTCGRDNIMPSFSMDGLYL